MTRFIKFKNLTNEIELNVDLIIAIIKRDGTPSYEIVTANERSIFITKKEYDKLKKFIKDSEV